MEKRLKWLDLFLVWSKWLNFFLLWPKGLLFSHISQRNEHFWIRLKELNTLNTTQRIEPIFKKKKKKSHRIEPFFLHDSKNWTFFYMTHRVEPFYQWDSKNLTFLNTTHRIELFLECDSKNWTLLFQHDTMNWTLFLRFKEMNNFFQHDSKNWIWLKDWTFFPIWPEESNTLLNVTQRIEPSSQRTQRIEPFFEEKLIQRIELFLKIWLQEFKTFLRLGRWNFFHFESKN